MARLCGLSTVTMVAIVVTGRYPRAIFGCATEQCPQTGFSRCPGSKWLLVSACARGRSWRRWLCHQEHIDAFMAEADDPLYMPGEGSLVGQQGEECVRIRACADLAVVELRAQRSAGVAAESDLIR